MAEADGNVLGAVLASSAGSSVSLACIAVHQELEEQAELLRCLLQFYIQLLLACGDVASLLQGEALQFVSEIMHLHRHWGTAAWPDNPSMLVHPELRYSQRLPPAVVTCELLHMAHCRLPGS